MWSVLASGLTQPCAALHAGSAEALLHVAACCCLLGHDGWSQLGVMTEGFQQHTEAAGVHPGCKAPNHAVDALRSQQEATGLTYGA